MFVEQEWIRHSHPLSDKAPHVYRPTQHRPTLDCEEPRISVSDSGLGQTLPIEDALKYEGREFEEMRPGMFCVTAGELHCRSESRFGRQWMAFSVDGDVPLEEVVAFFEEFLAGTGS